MPLSYENDARSASALNLCSVVAQASLQDHSFHLACLFLVFACHHASLFEVGELKDRQSEKERRLRLVDEAIDTFGTSLLNYARSLCTNNSVDAEALFDDVFIYALKKFPESKLTAFGYYRFKLFQLYIDRFRSERRRPDKPFEELPELPQLQAREPESEADEAAFAQSFFSEYPVDLSDDQKEMLILWGRHGFTHEQIGKKLGIPRSTVADQIKIGRAAIVEHVNKEAYKQL